MNEYRRPGPIHIAIASRDPTSVGHDREAVIAKAGPMHVHTLEITIQRRFDDSWPVVAQRFTSGEAAPTRREGILGLDLAGLSDAGPGETGELLGRAVFRDEVLRTFNESLAIAEDDRLHVLLHVEDKELRKQRWERLAAPLGGRWRPLASNQRTPFSLHLPSATDRRFPPISRHDLRALIVVANPARPESWRLPAFDAAAVVAETRRALGSIPSDTLCDGVDGTLGLPTLDAIATALTRTSYTILHVVAHGRLIGGKETVEPVVYLANASGEVDPVLAGRFIDALGLLQTARGLPHFMYLGTCEGAAPEAEVALGGLGQRLVRELGMPAVLAMTDTVSLATASALASEFYQKLIAHGEVDRALAEACAGIARHSDIAVPVPALFSRLAGRPLFSLVPDGTLTVGEILHGLDRLGPLIGERAPRFDPDFEGYAGSLRGLSGADRKHLSWGRQREWDDALAGVDELSRRVLELSFEGLAYDQEPPPFDARCPFKGLDSFKPADRDFFFGRETWVDRLKRRLARHPFLAVLGPSGGGKSSLVLAGLLPRLFDDEPDLRAAVFTPGHEPCMRLDEALETAGDGPTVVVVDQFEEVFTLCTSEDERTTFFRRILELAGSRRVVVTMRADFWGDCAPYGALRDRFRDHQELIPPLSPEELRGAMTAQAKAVGIVFEIGLDGTILADVEGEPGAMPLLQHALLELWNRRHGRRLVAGEYQEIGRVRGAIARTANQAYEDLFQPAEQDRVRDLFLRLVQVDESGDLPRDTRKRVRLEGLVPAGSDLASTRSLVERLADRRLVVTTPRGEDRLTEVEVAHEALISHWDRLKRWLDEDRAVLRLRQGIEGAAIGWERAARDEHYLVHKGPRLLDAERIRDDPRFGVFGLERDYVDACTALREKERVERERQRRLMTRIKQAAVATLAVFAVVVGFLYVYQVNLTHNLKVALVNNEIGGELERFDGSEEKITRIAGKIGDLRLLKPTDADAQQTALGQHLVDFTKKMIRKERTLSPEDAAEIERLIGHVKDYLPADVPELQLAVSERYRKPDLAFSFADSLSELGDVFEPGRVRPQGKGLIAGVAEPAAGLGLIPSIVLCRGDLEIQGRFTPGSSVAGSRIGLALNVGEGRGYYFTLSAPTAAGSPTRASMTIERNKVLLRKAEIDITGPSVGLFAQKKGDTVSFTVGKTTLEFEDVFPLSTGKPGVFGIILPEGVRLDSLAARRQQFPSKPGSLEEGDALFITGDYEKARTEFERAENTTDLHDTKVEAGYKKALCLVEQGGREDDAKPIFRRIAAMKGPFQTRAECQLWKIALRSGKAVEIEEADKIFDDLQANVNYTDLALVLSEHDRAEILAYYRQVGHFARIIWNKNRVRNLKRALEIEAYSNADRATLQRTRWRLADAYRLDGNDTEALKLIVGLLTDKELLPADRVGITRDYAGMMIVDRSPTKALEEIARWLGPALPGPDDLYFPMILDRARVHAAAGDYDRAEADVARFISLAKKPSITYNDFAAACLFYGFLLDRKGLKDEAMKAWRAGLRRNWPKDLHVIVEGDRLLDGKPLRDNDGSLLHFGMLASLTGDLDEDDARAILMETSGSGDFKTSPVAKIFDSIVPRLRSDLLSPAHVRAIVVEMYGTPAGREIARRKAYLELSLIVQAKNTILLALEAEVRLDAIPEGGKPELAALIHEGLEEIDRSVQDETFTPAQLGSMFMAWIGWPRFLGWDRVEDSLKDRPGLRGRIAYVYGRRFLVLKQPDAARHLFELCLGDLPAQSPFHKLAQEQLGKLRPK